MYFKDYIIEVTCLQEGKEKGYKVEIPAFKAIIYVDNVKDIPKLVEESIQTLLKEYKKRGIPVPKPDTEESNYSGRLSLRIPRGLHQSLTYQAKRQKVSLNQYLLYLLTKAVA